MRLGSKLLATLILSLAWSCSAAPDAGDDAPYPVWWSPSLELESLDQIEWRLMKTFARARQFHLVKYDLKGVNSDQLLDEERPELGFKRTVTRVNIRERWIEDCAALIEWTDEGFKIDHESPYRFHANWMNSFYSVHCYAIAALKRGEPAKTSYLRDFAFDEDALQYIPPMIGMGWDCRNLREFLEANRNAVPWSEFIHSYFTRGLPTYEITVVDDNTLVVEVVVEATSWSYRYVDYDYRIKIYGRGDFNGDGLDDLLIAWERRILTTSGETHTKASALYVATRRKPGGVLRVVDLVGPTPLDVQRCHLSEGEFDSQ